MSLEMVTYVPSVDDAVIPSWLSRMAELGMDCEIHPGFSFATQAGFLPFKLRIHDSAHTALNGVDFLTGFEFYLSDFSLDVELQALSAASKPSRRWFRKATQPAQCYYATPEVDAQLKPCRTRLHFVWGAHDLFELRMSTVSSAVLAEIGQGVSSYPADGIWYDRDTAAADAVAEARAYEDSLNPVDIQVHPFEEWL